MKNTTATDEKETYKGIEILKTWAMPRAFMDSIFEPYNKATAKYKIDPLVTGSNDELQKMADDLATSVPLAQGKQLAELYGSLRDIAWCNFKLDNIDSLNYDRLGLNFDDQEIYALEPEKSKGGIAGIMAGTMPSELRDLLNKM